MSEYQLPLTKPDWRETARIVADQIASNPTTPARLEVPNEHALSK